MREKWCRSCRDLGLAGAAGVVEPDAGPDHRHRHAVLALHRGAIGARDSVPEAGRVGGRAAGRPGGRPGGQCRMQAPISATATTKHQQQNTKQNRRTFFLSNRGYVPTNNGALLNMAHINKHVISSATKAELATLYIMTHEVVYIRTTPEEMEHPQPPTPLQTYNSMADGVVNGKITPKRTKAMDMRFHLLKDREWQKHFRIYWKHGKLNYADYWTKYHHGKHHQNVRQEFLIR